MCYGTKTGSADEEIIAHNGVEIMYVNMVHSKL